MYTSEGEKIAQQIWEETMSELSFAKVEDIIKTVNED